MGGDGLRQAEHALRRELASVTTEGQAGVHGVGASVPAAAQGGGRYEPSEKRLDVRALHPPADTSSAFCLEINQS
jgi:hypothetical protein